MFSHVEAPMEPMTLFYEYFPTIFPQTGLFFPEMIQAHACKYDFIIISMVIYLFSPLVIFSTEKRGQG